MSDFKVYSNNRISKSLWAEVLEYDSLYVDVTPHGTHHPYKFTMAKSNKTFRIFPRVIRAAYNEAYGGDANVREDFQSDLAVYEVLKAIFDAYPNDDFDPSSVDSVAEIIRNS